ncbi:MAG: DUF983 domain-containing protein [Bacteroidetes bacterium]|nr:DUF983 domain-containing protein [Bacteroidota bacterium]
MNQSCDKCEASFMPEPGFYIGAMYVSYAFTVVIFTVVSLILYFFVKPSDWVYLVAILISAFLFTPISFRYSRILYLYWFGDIQAKE